MKKIITVTTILLVSLLFLTYNLYNKENISNTKINKNNNMISIMLETEANSGTYNESKENLFPSDDYVFNNELSGCENGSKLSWDEESKQVIMTGNTTDKCYVYFDIYVEQVKTLSNYVISQYTGTQGENNIYYHDSTLTNGANDNSYRYAGANPNNYVCFGSDESTCPVDNLYRTIGVFDGKVKMIKADYTTSSLLGTDGDYSPGGSNISKYKGSMSTSEIATYYYNYKNDTTINSGNGTNTWSTSLLNKTNLNTNYLNNIGSKWANMIDTVVWKVGGNTLDNFSNVVSSAIYQNEMVNPTSNTTYEAKVGLMYASDYGFAADSSAWITPLYNANHSDYSLSSITTKNWMYMGLTEWIITPNTAYSAYSFYIDNSGMLYFYYSNSNFPLRPAFFLSSSIKYFSGDGTKTNPIRISSE